MKQHASKNPYSQSNEGDPTDPYQFAHARTEISQIETSVSDLIFDLNFNDKKLKAYLNLKEESYLGGSEFSNIGQLNIPGPFYTGTTYPFGTGILAAPDNVIFDQDCVEYVMIQPRSFIELEQIWKAGGIDLFSGYYCDGNKHWTVSKVREWWANRDFIFRQLEDEELMQFNKLQEKRYIHYLEFFAEMDLRRYLFFLEHGYYPRDEKLPQL